MSSFARWYVAKLQAYPVPTNMASALVLMCVGDLMAQEIEVHYLAEDESAVKAPKRRRRTTDSKKHQSPELHKLSFRRYGTYSPDIDTLQRQHMIRRQSIRVEEGSLGQAEHELISFSQLREGVKLLGISLYYEIKSLDLFRTGTMVFWMVAAYTPFYVSLYKLFDRYFPKGVTPMSVFARTASSLVVSVPLNAAFFCYGSFVHHLTEWLALLQEWRYTAPDASVSDLLSAIPFDFDMAWGAARLKLEAELWTTVKASACVWVPINLLNFSVVPPHLRPLALMSCSAFWNCYLSLAQHRSEDWRSDD